MLKRSRTKGENETAFNIVQQATNSPSKSDISRIMSHMGRLGGLKGGKARAVSLSADERKIIAQKAAKARWNKKT